MLYPGRLRPALGATTTSTVRADNQGHHARFNEEGRAIWPALDCHEVFFKGGEFRDLAHLGEEAARWSRDIAGQRVHGTTRRRPLQVFQDEERQALAPWDGEPYEITHWRTAKVHPDHHVACQYALYSVPSDLCAPGQQVEIGLGSKLARIYHRGRLLKLHPRQAQG